MFPTRPTAIPLWLILSFALRAQCPDSPAAWSVAAQEQLLRSGRIAGSKPLRGGVTDSLRVTLEAGGCRHDAHVQQIDEEKNQFTSTRGTEFGFRDTYRFNIAAYLLDRLLELNMVPPTVDRRYSGRGAAFTWWVDRVLMDEGKRREKGIDPPDAAVWNKQMALVRVFDQLIANTDRNPGNLLITEDWKIWMIDHTRAFRRRAELSAPEMLTRCDRALLARLRALDGDTVERAIGRYSGGAEVRALLQRREAMVRHFDRLIAAQGEAAVLFDYLGRN